MLEFRIHGRGGQGVQKTAQILSRAAFLNGFETQDFSVYGAERQGAPLTSFVRIEKGIIPTRGYVFEPDVIIVLDDSISREKTLSGKKKNTKVFINSPEEIREKNFYTFDAISIALKETGKAIANTAMLGFVAKKIPEISNFDNLEKAIRIELAKSNAELLEKNIQLAKKCFEMI